MAASKPIRLAAERSDLGAFAFTNTTTPRPSDAVVEPNSFNLQPVSAV
jgi:hypothetical protein